MAQYHAEHTNWNLNLYLIEHQEEIKKSRSKLEDKYENSEKLIDLRDVVDEMWQNLHIDLK